MTKIPQKLDEIFALRSVLMADDTGRSVLATNNSGYEPNVTRYQSEYLRSVSPTNDTGRSVLIGASILILTTRFISEALVPGPHPISVVSQGPKSTEGRRVLPRDVQSDWTVLGCVALPPGLLGGTYSSNPSSGPVRARRRSWGG